MSVGLVLGGFNLINEGSAYETSVLAEGTSRGNPVPIEVAVKSWLQDGAIVITQGHDNREVRLRVRFNGPDAATRAEAEASLAVAEAALFAELEKPNTLTWTPPYGSPASVFEVITSSLEHEDDDFGEVAQDGPYRTYSVRLVCAAFVRAVDETVTAAIGSGTMTVAPTPLSVVVDSGSATSGWSGSYTRYDISGAVEASGATAIAVVSGAVNSATPTRTAAPWVIHSQVTALRSGNVDVSVTKQLVVSWKWDLAGFYDPYISAVTGVQLLVAGTLVGGGATALTLDLVGGASRPSRGTLVDTIFRVPTTLVTITSMTLIVDINPVCSFTYYGQTIESVYVDQIVRNNADSSVTTPRQLQRTLAVAGSARTPAKVAIEHETSSLGDVLAYFWRDFGVAYSPPLRQFRTSGGGVTADTTLVSGAWDELVGTTTTFTIPANRVPSGNYLLMARIGGANTNCTVTWTATTVINGVDTGPSVTGSRASAPITTAYQNLPIGRMTLPTRDVHPLSTTAQVRITLTAAVSSGATARFDEAWIFHADGQLIAASCGTGTAASGGPSRRMYITPASVSTPRPAIRVGHLADESDSAFALATSSWQFPEFVPSSSNVLTVTSNALDAAVTLRCFRRAHTNIV